MRTVLRVIRSINTTRDRTEHTMKEFFRFAAGLKKTPRQGWIDNAGIDTPESVADHTYVTAVMAMAFGDMAGLDSKKMIQMALLHDLAESITGDLTPEMSLKADKREMEEKAMVRIMDTLPEQLRKKYTSIWNEYAASESRESQMVHELDKLEMALQASIYAEDGASTDEKLCTFIESAKQSAGIPEIKSMINSLESD